MLNRGDILFSCAVAVALLVFVHIIWAEVCRRWKLGQARKEELEYLVRLAAEEAAREEMETTLAYVPASIESTGVEINGGNRGFECAVCRRATSSRCSRCKTVRYCSGTCQIIHWRRGHKDECCLSKADHQYMLKKSSSHHSGLQVETSQSLGDNDTEDIALLLDSSRRDISHGSLVDSSSSYSTYPVFSQNYEEASNWEGLHLRHHAKAGDALSCDIADDDGPKKAADANCIEIPLVRIGSASLLVKNLSQTNNSNKKLSSFCTKDSKHRNIGVELDAICTENPLKHSNQNRTLGTNSTYENSSANSLVGTTKPNLRNCRVVGPVKSSFFLPRKSVDEGIVKARRLRSVSISLADHAFYDGRRHSGFDDSFSKVNNAPIMTSEFSKSAGFASSSKSHLKTSVKNMVHRFKLKPSLSSRGLSSMPMNFSYELFAKLFNSDKVDMDPFGLFNCGNSCFANVVLQCLVFTRPLTAYLLEGFHRAKCSIEGWCFTCEFEHLIVKGKQGKSPLSSVRILSHIHRIGSHFAHGREEDAHEFLRYAIDAMQYTCVKETGDVANNFTEATNLIQLTFGGCLRSEINCMKCKVKSEQLERIMDLTVEIKGDIAALEQALKQFTTTEVLDGENRYRCERCKSFEKAQKKLSVVEAPNILTIALKRFQLGKFGKLNKSIRFPVQLDLSPYMSRVDPCPLYNLYAVVVHVDVMNATFSGHYICYVKSMKGKWYMINDREVRPVELERVLKENAYLLFYARKSSKAPSLIKDERCQAPLKASRWFKKPANSNSMARRNHDHLHQPAIQSDFHGERLYFPRTDSFSDSLSLSCSDEGSWTTNSSMRNSTSTDDLSDYLFGGAQQSRWSRPLGSPDESDYITHSASTSRQYLHHEEYREGSEGLGNHSLRDTLYSDRSIDSFMLRENCRDNETYWNSPYGERSNVLMRSSTVKERRHQTLY